MAAGLDCTPDSTPDCGVPADAPIELRFDRHLLPSTAIRQSLLIHLGQPEFYVIPQPQYDLVERVVSYRLPRGGTWRRGVHYHVELRSPEEEGAYGFRAFDGAPLTEAGPAPIEFSFRVQTGDPVVREAADPPPSCQEALAVFARAGCQAAVCHQPATSDGCSAGYARTDTDEDCVGVPRMGLDLSDALGISETAINRVAHQTETGSTSGVPMESPARFGVAMPIIDPGRPDNSYLFYKMLRNQHVWENSPCESRYEVALRGQCPGPDEAESAALREWFVTGAAMPKDGAGTVRRDDLDLLQAWIRAGAALDDCD
jgi:hypothetical protein